ncbi:MAG: hypothetical protein PVJ69_19745 [Desulfobacteraceae bacterium]|jgi:hypothetical protein
MEQPIRDYPFRSVLSLEPLIDYLNRSVQDSQEARFCQMQNLQEMRHHIEFLQSEGYLTRELETVELADLPGVQGLKSFRVGVNLESQTLSEKAKMIAS